MSILLLSILFCANIALGVSATVIVLRLSKKYAAVKMCKAPILVLLWIAVGFAGFLLFGALDVFISIRQALPSGPTALPAA